MPKVILLKEQEEKSFELEGGETLYIGLERQGEDLPHGCLAGSCGACRLEIIQGEKNLSDISVIEKDTLNALKEEFKKKYGESFLVGKEIRLGCRAKILKEEVKIRTLK